LVVVITLVALVAVGLAGVSLLTRQTQTNGVGAGKSSSVSSALGLNFSLTAQPAEMAGENGVSIHVTLSNTRASTNNLPSQGSTLYSIGPCPGTLPFWFEVFQGNYNANNVSQGKSLALWQSWPFCGNGIPVASYSFGPNSSNVTVTMASQGPGQQSVKFSESAGYVDNYSGYWGTNSEPSANFTPFQPGVYTVLAGDSWGQEAVVHFQIIAP